MRAKHLTLLVAIFAIITMMFVSCNSEVAENSAISEPGKELVYASFVDKGAKDLSFSYDVPAYNTLYWRYSAVKKDSYGTVGQTWAGGTAEEVFAPIPTDASEPTQGLAGKVGPFSQGKWDFKLQAFRSCVLTDNTLVFSDKVFEGTATNVVLNKNQTNYIAVTVTPAGDTGKIKISDAYYEWASSANAGTAQVKLVVTLVGRPDGSNSTDPVTYTYTEVLTKETSENKYKFNGVGGYIAIPVSTTEVTTEIPAGVYTATFKVVENTDTPTIDEFAIQAFSLKVYGGLETIISGNLTEGLSIENYFSVPEQTIAFTTSDNAGAASFEVDKTPSTATGETIKTTVVFPDNSLSTNTQHTLSVDVTTIETAETQFVIVTEPEQNPEVAVAAIGLELTQTIVTKDESGAVTDTTTEKVSDFDEYVTITTYIQDCLTGKITVVYNDPNAGTSSAKSQPIAKDGATAETTDKSVASMYATDELMGDKLGYSAESGKLRFKTNHFSDFYVKTDGLCAKNIQTGRYYSTLQTAVDAALEGQTVQVIKDVVDLGTTGLTISGKDVTLDLNGKTITGTVNGKLITIASEAKVVIMDSSETSENQGTGRVYNKDVSDQGHDAVCNNGILTVNSGSFGGPFVYVDNVLQENTYNRGGGLRNLGECTINGGYFTACKNFVNGGYAYAVINTNGGSLVINGGTIIGHMNGGLAVDSGNVTVNDVDIKVLQPNGSYNYNAIYISGSVNNPSVVVVNGGSFESTNINTTGNCHTIRVDSNYASLNISDGIFRSPSSYANIECTKSLATISVVGGLYNNNTDLSKFIAPGYKVVAAQEEGWWTVESIFDESGTEDDPYIIGSIDAWMELVHMCENDSTFASTNGKYFKMTSDVDVSSKTERATVHYFAGHIDFSGHTLCGFNSNNTVPGDVGDDGIVAAFSIVSGDVSISNLVYEINTIKNSQTVYNQLVGMAPYYADGVKLLFDSVTVNGLATGVSGNNHSPLFAYAVYNTNLTISCKDCTNNATIIGSGYKSAFIGNLSYIKSGVLSFDTCINNGVIISTDSPASMLVSNGDSYLSDASISFVINDCVNNGVISGKSNYAGLVLGMLSATSSYTNIYTFNENKSWSDYISDKSIGGELTGSDVAIITTTSINTNDGYFILPETETAKYYQLQFSFAASSHAGGNVGYVVEFGNKSQQFTGDLPNDVAVSSWVDDETKDGDVSEYNITGATSGVLYKDSQGHYVFNESGSRLRDKVLVSFIVYGENNQVLSIATYQY